MFNSPVAVAMWDLFFNIHSNEIGDYLFQEFQILSKMAGRAENRLSQQECEEWLNKVQNAVYRTEDFVDKIRSEALNDRLDATSPTKKSTLHKTHFRPMWVRNLSFWSKKKPEVKKGIEGEEKKIVDEFCSLTSQGYALHLGPDGIYLHNFFNCGINQRNNQRNLWNGKYQEHLQNDIDRYRRLSTFFVADS